MGLYSIKTAFFLGLIFLSTLGYAQNFGDKTFYLIDSLDLEQLTLQDRELLDSCLNEVAAAKEDTVALTWIVLVTDVIDNDDIGEQYSIYACEYIKSHLSIHFLSRKERKFYYNYLAVVYTQLGYYENSRGAISASLHYYQEAFKIFESFGDKEGLGTLYLNLSGLYYGMRENDIALEYSNKALEIANQIENKPELMVFALNNLAVLYSDMGNVEKSLEYQFRSLAICDSTGNKFGAGMINNNIGGVYSQMEESDLAFKHFKLAEEIFQDIGNDTWASFTYHKMGSAFLANKEFQQAEKYANLCFEHAELSGDVQPKLRAANLLYRLNEKAGNYEEAFYFYQKHEHLVDSISGEKIRMTTRKMEMDFQIEKEKVIADKENEKKLEVSIEREKRQELISYAILGGLILVCIFMFILFFRLRIIIKQKKVIEKQNDERKLLLKEIHHRVKNNFQIVSSVLKLQAAEENNTKIDRAFDDAINRIHSMAAVHEMIYKQDDFAAVAPKNYFNKLTDSMRTYALQHNIQFDVDSEVEALSVQTLIPLGISVNEMITNSIKYAFTGEHKNPKIRIRLNQNNGNYILTYQDNGIGFASHLKSDSFGMELIETILEQIEGKLEKEEDTNWSTHLNIRF